MKKLILIDGNAIFHRAFHALPLLTNSKNEYTNAIYGFTKMLFDVMKHQKPDYMAIAFDHKAKTFRHIEYVEYKANRSEPPPELYPQMPRLRELLDIFQIPVFDFEGFEADDILGSLACQAEKEPELKTIILTGDKDAFQLVNEKIEVMTPKIGLSSIIIYTPEKVEEALGLKPSQVIDYKALKGDPSDNIPGVKGIGEKQAVDLLKKYTTLENIYEHLHELPEGQRKKLEDNKETALISKKLATIICDMPIKLELEACRLHKLPLEEIKKALENLEFKSLIRQLETLSGLVEKPVEIQPTLF